MGILKPGRKCIIMKGRNFGKKITVKKVKHNLVHFKLDNKEQKINVLHIFPLK